MVEVKWIGCRGISEKTPSRLVLGQLLPPVMAVVLAWIVIPKQIDVEWRGFVKYYNPATLETEA